MKNLKVPLICYFTFFVALTIYWITYALRSYHSGNLHEFITNKGTHFGLGLYLIIYYITLILFLIERRSENE